MKKKIFAMAMVAGLTLVPAFALALDSEKPLDRDRAGSGTTVTRPPSSGGGRPIENLKDLLNFFIELINDHLIPIVFSLALLYFLYGVANYISKAGDTKARQEGINIMLWGIIGLFVMTSVWGLVNLLRDTFDFNDKLPTPQFKLNK